MRFLIAGAGAIGGYIGACMSRAGLDVTLYARGPHLRAMQQSGLRILSAEGDFEVRPRVIGDLGDAGQMDVIFLGVKAHGLTQLAPQLRELIGENTTVVSTQNGIPWWYFQVGAGEFAGLPLTRVDPGGVISSSIDPRRVVGSLVYLGTEIVEPGVIRHTEGNRISLGEPDGSRSERCRAIAEALIQAGLRCPVTTRLRNEIWVKLLGNVAFNPISALTRATLTQMARDPDVCPIVRKIMTEVEAVANKLGVTLPISIEQRIAGAEKVGEHKTSMLQDLEANRPMELEPVVGAVVELGEQLGIDMPYTRTVYACTRLLEAANPAGKAKMNRWIRLIAAVVAMVMIGNLQYAWTLFVQPMMSAHGWKLSEVQWGFTVFIAVMTWTMPLSGWLIDRLGPRLFMTMAGLLCGAGWALLGYARSLPEFYALYAVAGLGNAFVYCCSTALGLKWFPDKRGVASGLIAAGYGSGAAFFNPFFGYLIRTTDYRTTFLYSGIVLGVLVLIAGQFLKYPPMGFVPAPPPGVQPKIRRHAEQFNSLEMLRTPQFYVLFVMMLMIGIGGLMATAQVAPVARNFKVGATALTIALSLNPLANGASRFLWGWVSDSLGREHTMAIAFSLQAVFLSSVATLGRQGDTWFVVTMVLVFLTWGELYVLFPATLADIFGARHAASNYSFLYITKGLASILAGGLAAQLFEKTGSWNYAFYGSSALALCSATIAVWLRRMPLPKKAVESKKTG